MDSFHTFPNVLLTAFTKNYKNQMNKVQSYIFSWDQVEQATFLNMCPVYRLQNSWNIKSSGNK